MDFLNVRLSRNCTPDNTECVTTEVLLEGYNENGTSTAHSPPEESVSPPDEYRKDRCSPPAETLRLRRNVVGTEVHLQIPMEKLANFHGYVTTTEYSPNHQQQRYQRIRYLEYRGQSPDTGGGGGSGGGGFEQPLIKYEHHQQQQHQQGKMDPNSSYVTLESVGDVYQQQQQQQQQQNYQQQNSYQTYQSYEGEQPSAADNVMFNIYDKDGHGGAGAGGGGGDYVVKGGHQKVGYGQQSLQMQQQQQQQQHQEYQEDCNGNGGVAESGEQSVFWGAHEQQVADFTSAANETLAAANALQMQEAGLGPPDGSIQVAPQYTIFHTGNPGPSWIDEHFDQSKSHS